MLSKEPSVAVVILNYNGRKLLEKFLPSVLATTYPSLQLYVADNGSSDDSLQWLSQAYPAINRIVLANNIGFAAGYNEALKRVDADYYVLLNSDVEVTSGWIDPVIALMENNLQIAICQPKIRSYNNKDTFEYAGAAGGWVDTLGYPFARGRVFDTVEKDEGQYDDVCNVFWASGAAMFVRKEVWKAVGGFDGYLFAHQEEIDFCWRTQLAGFLVQYCPDSIVYHVGGATLQKSNPRKTYLNFRNSLILLGKNLPFGEREIKIFSRLVLDGIFGVKLLLAGHFADLWAIVKAHFGFYKWVFFADKNSLFKKKKLSTLQGVVTQSIVWNYFIRNKKNFSEIVHKK